jgi:hypothetical protein
VHSAGGGGWPIDEIPDIVSPTSPRLKDGSRAARSWSREHLVFALAGAGIVLYVLVDTLVALEPGAKRSDHVLAAAVPVAIVAVSVWLYPRLRPGLRAALALSFGALALVGAGVALTDGDWIGVVLGIAGLALCVLGPVVLWRSRRSDGRRRYLRGAFVVVAAGLVAFWVIVPIAFAIVATHRPDGAVARADLGRPYEEVTIHTDDGLELAAWYVPSRNGAAVVVFPDREGTVAQARMLARHGYGVLALDTRGYGESEGDPNAFGWGATKDVDAAIAYLRGRSGVEDGRIGGLGLSVGGEQMLEAAAGNSGLGAVVSEGAGERSVRETFTRGAAAAFVLPQQAVLTAATAVLSGEAPPPSLEQLVPKIAPRPILLIHAGQGNGGEDLNVDYFAAAGEPKELWEIPEASHTGGIEARPGEYGQRVVEFFDRALLG